MKLTNNTVLITGGTSGIGLQLAIALKNRGNTVLVFGTRPEAIERARDRGLHAMKCDLRNQSDIEAAVAGIEARFPQLNMLINNAGIQYNYRMVEGAVPYLGIADEITVNLTGQIQLTQMLLPVLLTGNAAFIINTTSGLGAYPKSDGLVYSATKAAMRNFTVGLRNSLQKHNVRVLEFIPPVTDTGMTANRAEKKMDPANLAAAILPQLEKERKVITVRKMRFFLFLATFFPGAARRITG